MGILVAATTGMVFWVTAWAFGIKSFDAFMVATAIVLLAVAARFSAPLIAKLRGQDA